MSKQERAQWLAFLSVDAFQRDVEKKNRENVANLAALS